MALQYGDRSDMNAERAALTRYEDESQSSKLARKSKEAPLFPIGIAGLTLACIYGAYKFKHRGNMSASVYLMQLRVAAQGTVVACLSAGLAYSLFKEYVLKSEDSIEKKD